MKKDKNQEEALWQRMEAAVAREKAQQVSPYLATRVMARLDDNPSPGFVWAPVLRSVAVLLALVFGFLSAHWSSDRKSTRLNSSHVRISYAVFCLKKKK